jgi:CubicO group peptidase (beta-lactamase class C family)
MGAKGDLPSGVDAQKLADALDEAFSEPDPKQHRGTRAVIVVYDGRIIAERYASGFTQEMPLIGWSMTKSVTNALVGILVGQGKLSIEEPASVPEWSKPDDPRRAITLDQLLRMSSGLDWSEGLTDLTAMLFGSACSDVAAYAANKPLAKEPDSIWYYSSGTANIIARIIRDAVGGTQADYFAFPRRALFDKIGMRSAVMEPDASGTFVGSSFMYATARDWARFGLLYLNDGLWEGERILPEGWATYSSTPTPSAPRNEYGALFWTIGQTRGEADAARIPADAYSALGYEAQNVTIIPSRNLVMVRLGLSQPEDAWNLESFIVNLLKAIPE